jgi:hypothetical protein
MLKSKCNGKAIRVEEEEEQHMMLEKRDASLVERTRRPLISKM